MSIPKKSVSGTTGPAATPVLPRTWLIALAILLTVPWLIAGAIYVEHASEDDSSPVEAASAPSDTLSGPWGSLSLTPIVISPPMEYVSSDWGPPGDPVWYFPGATVAEVQSFLTSAGLSPDAVARLRTAIRTESRIGGVVVTPDRATVAALSPEARSRLYMLLAKVPLNFDQAHSFRFLGTSTRGWLEGSQISPETRRLVEPFIYRDADVLHFADLEVIRPQLSTEEVRRLSKTLLRQSTVLARLEVDDPARVGSLVEYWGQGGRKTDLRPLLESLAEGGSDRSIDIAHLLPPFARNYLYRYPKLTAGDLDKPVLANCLWTALNFFRAQPDDRFLDVGIALDALKRDYYVIESGFQLGDVIAFLDAEDDLFHVAVHIAGDLVLTKNGTSPMAPWILLTVDQVKAYYRTRSAEPRLMYHRRNDL